MVADEFEECSDLGVLTLDREFGWGVKGIPGLLHIQSNTLLDKWNIPDNPESKVHWSSE